MNQQLTNKTLDELKVIATELNIKYHPSVGADKLLERINQQSQRRVEAAVNNQKPEATSYNNSEEEVREALKTHLANPNFQAEFMGDGTVIFRCKGAEDSVNLNIPLRVIKQKATTVAAGARKIPLFKKSNTGVYSDDILYA